MAHVLVGEGGPSALNRRFAVILFVSALVGDAAHGELRLARELSAEGDHAGAALEFRRLSLSAPASAAGSYLWASAHEYFRAGDWDRADKLLGRAESQNPDMRAPVLLLRAEVAGGRKAWEESAFYYECLLGMAEDTEVRRYVARKAAAAKARARDWDGAAALLAQSPVAETNALAALCSYREGRDKSVGLGGVLGMIPGAGYMYAGEWANGFRSLILNAIFIFGMVHTAQEEQWGAFAVISFFEFTWYSGSIYGGIDASHRYNRKRLETCAREIAGGATFEPDYGALPAISLRYRF